MAPYAEREPMGFWPDQGLVSDPWCPRSRVDGTRDLRGRLGESEREPPRSGSTSTRKPCITPDRFDGSIPWRDYREHFEACASINGWNETEKARFLAACLKGSAQQILGDHKEPLEFAELLKLLERRFGPGERAEVHLAELRGRNRKPKESLPELGQAIRRLTVLAYPKLSCEAQERLARMHFADAEPDKEIRLGIFRANPSTLDEAIRAAQEVESYMESERMRYGGSRDRRVRTLESSKDPQGEEISLLRKRVAELEAASRRQPSRNSTIPYNGIQCYNCGQRGHISRNCPALDSVRPGSGNGGQAAPRVGKQSRTQ